MCVGGGGGVEGMGGEGGREGRELGGGGGRGEWGGREGREWWGRRKRVEGREEERAERGEESAIITLPTYWYVQLCDELRALDLTTVRLKAYIDQLLAVVLESSPCLLEGLPRIQQNSGLKMELFSLASLTEVR